ncbi:hypothetical protein ES703_30749 [subsurface metagenome]
MEQRYFPEEPSRAEAWYYTYEALIFELAQREDWNGAQRCATEWANGVSAMQKLGPHHVWKQFKRNVLSKWFGEPERKFFAPKWDIASVLKYVCLHDRRNVRVSLFLPNIACHSESICLHPKNKASWHKVIARLDRNTAIEVFPESSTHTSVCFRMFRSAFGENVVYEAGRGQAMRVFESEQGKHSIVSARAFCNRDYIWERKVSGEDRLANVVEVEKKLRQLIYSYGWHLETRCFGICRSLGIEQIAVEGYFDAGVSNELTIVDMDLPFDYVFMH